MKAPFLRLAGLIGGVLLAGTPSAPADQVVVRGTTTFKGSTINYLSLTNVSRLIRENSKLQFIGSYSSLGNTGYSFYTLDNREKQAFKSTGDFDKGPTIFQNFNDSGLGYEVHKQFNGKWWEDLPDIGDEWDIKNQKLGSLEGARRLVRLRNAGFDIEVAKKLSGNHTLVRSSWDFGIDPSVSAGFSAGRFFQVQQLRSSVRLDVKLSDEANFLSGSLGSAISVIENHLAAKNFVIIDVGPLPH